MLQSIALLLGFAVLFGYHFFTQRGRQIKFHWRASLWIWPYFIGISLISYLGNFGHGRDLITHGWDFIVIAIFSALILWVAVYFRLPNAQTQKYIDELELKH
ncbi:MAG: hypothetical protein K0U12_07790 [Gammaproteobacteria bacterium]|nr:hypothetical protein [Gammaproteobacteria bacterium]